MGCLSASSTQDSNSGINRTYTLGVGKKQTNESEIKLVNGLFVLTSTENPFDSYQDLKVIGEGSFGKVHKVINKSNSIIRAMKVLDWEKIKDTTNVNSTDLINEIQFVKNLDHPNILKIFEIFDFEGKIYIVSEICTGGELFEYVTKKGRLKENEVSNIMRQIFSAIKFYQNYGIIHSDIKPENVLIESKEDLNNGRVNCKLIDFGLASKMGKQTSISDSDVKTKVLGTISYMAPEAFEGQVSFKSDIWSAGIILYFLLQGKLPFRGDTNDDVIKAIKKCEFNYLTDISFEAKDLLGKILIKDKSKRISAKEALEHRFITKYIYEKSRSSLSKEKVNDILGNLRTYRVDKKLQEIVLGFIVNSISDSKAVRDYRNLFNEFDLNGDGELSYDELEKCLSTIMSSSDAKKEVDRIVKVIDSDKNGFITSSEFIRASIDPKTVLTDENLISVYNIFDKDRSGKISYDEIANVIAKDLKVDSEICKKMIKEVDINGDGELSISEFKKMMRSIFEQN